MWQVLIPIIASLVGKNNPQAGNTLNTALQISKLFGNGGAKLPNRK